MFKFELGAEVKSKITGFRGIITARSEHINGCDRYWVEPKCGKDMKLPGGLWVDDIELIVLKKPIVSKTSRDTGGFPSKIK